MWLDSNALQEENEENAFHLCSNSLCSTTYHSQASPRLINPYHTVAACDMVTGRRLH